MKRKFISDEDCVSNNFEILDNDDDNVSNTFVVPNLLTLPLDEFCGISCLKYHPIRSSLLVAGSTDGRIFLYDCSTDDATLLYKRRWHTSCRAIDFNNNGCHILTGSKQGVIRSHDIETKQRLWHSGGASGIQGSGISVIKSFPASDRLISGHDDGMIRLWDCRVPPLHGPVFEISALVMPNEELEPGEMAGLCTAVNDLCFRGGEEEVDPHFVMVAMDDGTLTTVNIKRRRVEMKSETLAYAATSVCILKSGMKVAVGTEEGYISMFNWEQWGNLCDRIPVTIGGDALLTKQQENGTKTKKKKKIKKCEVECMVKLSEDVLCVATNDGIIRAINVLPNRNLGVIGNMTLTNDSNSPASCMCMSLNHEANVLVAANLHDASIQFWGVEHLLKLSSDETEMMKMAKGKRVKLRNKKLLNKAQSKGSGCNDMLQGLVSAYKLDSNDVDNDCSDCDSDSDDSDDF